MTAVIKAKNEETNIVEAIRSARLLADEVIVVDDNSEDRTGALARAEGARVIAATSVDGRIDELDKIGFAAASGHWILRLDADERLTEDLGSALRRAAEEGSCDAVAFPRRNMMFGDWPRHGGWFASDQVRFFRRSAYDPSWSAEVHSQVPVNGITLRLPTDPRYASIHLDYDSVTQFSERTLWRYAAVEAADRYRKGIRFSAHNAVLRPLRMFFGRFVVRRGVLDGRRGLVLALLLGSYEAVIQCQLWDLERQDTGSRVHQD
ncbi:MAG: glycosyltransferase family 2 protein [Kineosporiaceae bacterium]